MIYFFQNCHTLRKLNFDPLKINCVKSELNILFLNLGWIKVIGPIHNLIPVPVQVLVRERVGHVPAGIISIKMD